VQCLVASRLAEQGGCPHCDSAEVVKHGSAHGTQRFRCKGCGNTVPTALTGTPFHRLWTKAKLLENAACLADGLSIRKTAERLGFSVDKTFRWRHKFLSFLNTPKPKGITGVVETDETLFAQSFKGQRRGLPRASKKRGDNLKTGEGAEKVAVVVALQRGTRTVFDQILPSAKATDLTEALRPAMGADAVLSTDGNASYWTVAKELNVQLGFFISAYHGKGGNGTWHVQGVNGYDSSLKSWMNAGLARARAEWAKSKLADSLDMHSEYLNGRLTTESRPPRFRRPNGSSGSYADIHSWWKMSFTNDSFME